MWRAQSDRVYFLVVFRRHLLFALEVEFYLRMFPRIQESQGLIDHVDSRHSDTRWPIRVRAASPVVFFVLLIVLIVSAVSAVFFHEAATVFVWALIALGGVFFLDSVLRDELPYRRSNLRNGHSRRRVGGYSKTGT